MGGNAFRSTLTSAAFPRLPPVVYRALKARLQPILEDLYVYVAVPHEAPEKKDYGDLDFVVCLPRRPPTSQIPSSDDVSVMTPATKLASDDKTQINVPQDIVASAIGATQSNPMDGNRTSNFAIPITKGEWTQYGHQWEETLRNAEVTGEEIFYQVDVNVCESKEQWNRRVFFNSYGDLNIILGLIVKNTGLHYSSYGLKLPDHPNPPFLLSESFDDILDFYGWSREVWRAGFETNIACYMWAVSSKYFNPRRLKTQAPAIRKRNHDRTMYVGFTEWVTNLSPENNEGQEVPPPTSDVRQDALDFFGKRAEFEERKAERRRREMLKTLFSGSHVRDWTGLGNYWTGVKRIMDVVRERCDGDKGVVRLLEEEGEEKLRTLVLQVQEELQIYPLSEVAAQTEEQKLITEVKALDIRQ